MKENRSDHMLAVRCAPAVLMFALAAVPASAWGCACGCGVFDVGTVTMMPAMPGAMVYAEDDFMSQSQNWVGTHAAPSAANSDKEIQTQFAGLGASVQFDANWGLQLKVPFWDRLFRTDVGAAGAPQIVSFRHSALGDVRLEGRYTGWSSDLSTGLTFGLKLPTGDWTYPNFDRDTSIGTGTTDLLLGGYHIGRLTSRWQWFGELLLDRAFNSREQYRPGNELDGALGVIYRGWNPSARISIDPLLQLIGSDRLHDSGANADPPNSGYHRVLLSPGVEATVGSWNLYLDAEWRLYHSANAASSVAVEGTQGQLVAPVLIKAMISYHW